MLTFEEFTKKVINSFVEDGFCHSIEYLIPTTVGLPVSIMFSNRREGSEPYITTGGELPNEEVSPLELEKVSGVFKGDWGIYYREAYKIKILKKERWLLAINEEEKKFIRVLPAEPEDHILLSNGKVLMNKFGKYEPNLCFINDIPHLTWERNIPASKFNLEKGSFDVLRGTFFISKKGTKCFRIEANGPHILIKEDWGGAFCRHRGRNIPESQALYYRRATSNGGGMGCDYGIYPASWQYILSEEDI